METESKFSLISKILLNLIPLLAVLGTFIPLIIGMPSLSQLGLYLAVPMLLGVIIYKKQKHAISENIKIKENLFSIFLSSYFLLFFISIVILDLYNVRPYMYYFIIAMMSMLLAFEILKFEISEKRAIIILFQIMILTLDILWGVTLKYDNFISRTDPLAHIWLIKNLVNDHYLTDVFNIYKPFPLWHILCTCLYEILSIPFKDINKLMFFTNGLIYSFNIPLTYLIVNKIFNDKKISLLSSLFMTINPDIITYGMASIPRSVITFLELMLILVLLDYTNKIKRLLAIFLVFPIIIYHTVSIPFLILIFIGICLIQKLLIGKEKNSFIKIEYIILVITITLFYWIYYSGTLFETLIENILIPAPSGILTKSIIYTPLNELFNYIQYSPLLLFIIVGFFEVIESKKISNTGKIFCIIGLLGIIFAFPGPVLLLNKLTRNFNLMRFGEYIFLFISICASIGFINMYSKARKKMKICIMILFILTVFFSVSNDFTASDNPLVKRPFFTYYLTDEEIMAFNQISRISSGYIMSDYVTCRYLMVSLYADKSHILEVDVKNMKFLRNNDNDIMLIRNGELTNRPLKFYTSESKIFIQKPAWDYLDYYSNDLDLWNDLEKYNEIYESKDVTGFVSS